MGSWSQSIFKPKNPQKCINVNPVKCRSSWEAAFCRWLDEHPGVVQWGSEVIAIDYWNPIKKRPAKYYPDFLIKYIDAKGVIKTELIEIKPSKETCMEQAKSRYDKIMIIQNRAKWEAAFKVCKQADITFRILTEAQLFRGIK